MISQLSALQCTVIAQNQTEMTKKKQIWQKLYTSVTDATRKTYLASPNSQTTKNIVSRHHYLYNQRVPSSDNWAIFTIAWGKL